MIIEHLNKEKFLKEIKEKIESGKIASDEEQNSEKPETLEDLCSIEKMH